MQGRYSKRITPGSTATLKRTKIPVTAQLDQFLREEVEENVENVLIGGNCGNSDNYLVTCKSVLITWSANLILSEYMFATTRTFVTHPVAFILLRFMIMSPT